MCSYLVILLKHSFMTITKTQVYIYKDYQVHNSLKLNHVSKTDVGTITEMSN